MISKGTDQPIIIFPGKARGSEKEKLRQFVSKDFMIVSYPILKRFGPSLTIFLTCLINLEVYNEKKNRIDADGYFMIKREFIQEQIGLTRKQQGAICNKLISLNLIKCIRKGHGRIGWVRLNHSLINLAIGNCTFDDADM